MNKRRFDSLGPAFTFRDVLTDDVRKPKLTVQKVIQIVTATVSALALYGLLWLFLNHGAQVILKVRGWL